MILFETLYGSGGFEFEGSATGGLIKLSLESVNDMILERSFKKDGYANTKYFFDQLFVGNPDYVMSLFMNDHMIRIRSTEIDLLIGNRLNVVSKGFIEKTIVKANELVPVLEKFDNYPDLIKDNLIDKVQLAMCYIYSCWNITQGKNVVIHRETSFYDNTNYDYLTKVLKNKIRNLSNLIPETREIINSELVFKHLRRQYLDYGQS